MNSVTHPNANNDDATAVVNIGNHCQIQFQQLSPIQNTQQPSSASSCINGGVDPFGCDPCVHCHCGCHRASMETAYLDSLPIGYRFLPTDEELIVHYLWKKIKNENLPKNRISDANVYGNHPKDLAGTKYGRGTRPSRSAGSGYWKATGLDRAVKVNGTKIGGRKNLVYYEGHQPKGTKTSWMMHEYVVEGYGRQRLGLDDMKLDDYVLCKIYKKRMKKEVVTDQEPSVVSSDQDENISIDIQEQNEQVGQVMVLDQQAHVVSNQDVVVQHSNQNLNPTIPGSNQDMNPGGITGAKEVKRQVMVRDQPARGDSSQDIKMGSLYDLMTFSTTPVQMTSFQPMSAPLGDQSCPTRFDHKYTLQNPPYFPPPPQLAPAAFQDSNDFDGGDTIKQNIELMYANDGYDGLSFDDNFQFQLI
ncbi:hypothetical protein L1987_67715 [Smallanthus sonchifolius]|uniref:Uncharacterized protein n=1 Tax=Smallanthus sonchifolius TaxID=185202 RepID=A0ACB9B404_9ASTR|nr:hypothetical protein L1987_67715 [Smallanthus sonchifolius]